VNPILGINCSIQLSYGPVYLQPFSLSAGFINQLFIYFSRDLVAGMAIYGDIIIIAAHKVYPAIAADMLGFHIGYLRWVEACPESTDYKRQNIHIFKL